MTQILMTPKEAARRYAISASTLRRWAREGRLRCVRMSERCIRFRVSDLERFFEDHEVDAPLEQAAI